MYKELDTVSFLSCSRGCRCCVFFILRIFFFVKKHAVGEGEGVGVRRRHILLYKPLIDPNDVLPLNVLEKGGYRETTRKCMHDDTRYALPVGEGAAACSGGGAGSASSGRLRLRASGGGHRPPGELRLPRVLPRGAGADVRDGAERGDDGGVETWRKPRTSA